MPSPLPRSSPSHCSSLTPPEGVPVAVMQEEMESGQARVKRLHVRGKDAALRDKGQPVRLLSISSCSRIVLCRGGLVSLLSPLF